jgi:hypothetical protein
LGKFKSETVNSLYPSSGKYRHLRADLFGMPTMSTATITGIFTFTIFSNDPPINFLGAF